MKYHIVQWIQLWQALESFGLFDPNVRQEQLFGVFESRAERTFDPLALAFASKAKEYLDGQLAEHVWLKQHLSKPKMPSSKKGFDWPSVAIEFDPATTANIKHCASPLAGFTCRRPWACDVHRNVDLG